MTTQAQTENLAAITNPNKRTVILDSPIKIGGQDVTEITVYKPSVHHLRGINLQQLYQSHVDSVLTILPKITDPQLIPALHDQIDPIDLTQLAGSIIYFLMPKSQRQLMEE